MKKGIVIANASGFWGDEIDAIERQVHGGPIDYLTMDYLAEITMIILARQKAKDPKAGYARDFVTAISRVLHPIAEKGITVIANAGGMNPVACAEAMEALIKEERLDLPVAVVDGDDLMPRLGELAAQGQPLAHMDNGKPLDAVLERVVSANAYLGARPIVAALEKGARIVITGRTYDAASVVAPMVFEFGWGWEDYDRLASALLAGHLIECGTQSTGGNYTRWQEVPTFSNMGYPVVEAYADGSFVLTKHPNTGGLVNTLTAKEQILYEIGDPRFYMSPDVIADFTSFHMLEEGPDRVRFHGVKGRKPTPSLKVSITYENGFKVAAMLVVSGPEVLAKAQKFAEMFWERVGDGFSKKRTDFVGYSACWGDSAAPPSNPNEIILRFAAHAYDKAPLQRMSREVAGLVLSGPPGVTVFGGRPAVTPAYGFWPALISRQKVTARLLFRNEETLFNCEAAEADIPVSLPEDGTEAREGLSGGERIRVPLSLLAHARSGDKGDICNIGVAAYKPEFYPELLRELTPDRVATHFRSQLREEVQRYRLDNLHAVNFILKGALDDGGTTSLLLDNQGKTLSQALLAMEIDVDKSLLEAFEGQN